MTIKDSGQNNGLTTKEALELQKKYGKNELTQEKKESIFHKILHVLKEPMFILLLLAAIIYFILGEPRDGAIMLVFVIGIISIDVIQEWKTDKSLNALKDLSAPHIKVIRDGKEKLIASADLVPGDLMLISEGVKIPADGKIIKSSDLCIDESSLTGESEGVWKIPYDEFNETSDYFRKDCCYAGTLVTQGSALVYVDKIGTKTEYGKIGESVLTAPENPTPLQRQVSKLVKTCAVIAFILFFFMCLVTYLDIADHAFYDRIVESILSGITLAMAMIPEEFPVILTVFLSMGAWRLSKKNSLVKRLPSVETLGAVSVLCVDKTGTITLNKMTVQKTWTPKNDEDELTEVMGLACETDAYDPMEKAMLSYCESRGIFKDHIFGGEFIEEYPFTNEEKMMGHVWKHDGEIIIAAKGSPERILTLCALTDEQRVDAENKIIEFSKEALRVIAVGQMKVLNIEDIPEKLNNCTLEFCGLVGLADPPRETVKGDIENCVKAGIRVVMITGDNGITASAIAKKIGMPNSDNILTGDEINLLNDEQLAQKVRDISVFSRVIPEHKMRIVKAFKAGGEIVAMTGDGVNDAPALKYADIGIAMGKRGSEVSREAADLILMDDNFSTIIDTIKDGRRIYDNIRKAIGYVFTIHIPIAFSSLLAPLLGIDPSNLFLLPLHVVLLELIIDPTCSIVLERQPAERDIMNRAPRDPNENILTSKLLLKSILQGVVILLASFGTYYYTLLNNPTNAPLARSMALSIIVFSNLLLVNVNSSNTDFVLKSIRQLIKDKVMILINLGTIVGLALILYSPLNGFLKLTPLNTQQLLYVIAVAFAAVLWYELVKLANYFIRKKKFENIS